MRTFLRRAAAVLLFAVMAVLLTIVCLPPFLDRIYYRGPASDHFDGQRFFNPDDHRGTMRPAGVASSRMLRFVSGIDRAPWPGAVPVGQGYPMAAVTPCPPVRGGVVHEAWSGCVPSAAIDPNRMVATWIGHATVLVQTQRIAILTDPIWSERASPVGFAGPKRVRAPGIALENLPKIDLILISHDHYDHLDLSTLKALWARDRPLIVTSLGNDAILRGAGIPAVARDWGGRVGVRPGISVIVERVHHWGSRWGSDRDRALWSGFTVVLPGGNLFFAGDTGMGDGRWVAAAAARGPVRLALLPIGAYAPRTLMQPNHVDPDEAVAVFRRLHAGYALGIHWGTFPLTDEAIDAPPRDLARALHAQAVAPTRFRTTPVGVPWEIGR